MNGNLENFHFKKE